jgi:hypothetical protein
LIKSDFIQFFNLKFHFFYLLWSLKVLYSLMSCWLYSWPKNTESRKTFLLCQSILFHVQWALSTRKVRECNKIFLIHFDISKFWILILFTLQKKSYVNPSLYMQGLNEYGTNRALSKPSIWIKVYILRFIKEIYKTQAYPFRIYWPDIIYVIYSGRLGDNAQMHTQVSQTHVWSHINKPCSLIVISYRLICSFVYV